MLNTHSHQHFSKRKFKSIQKKFGQYGGWMMLWINEYVLKCNIPSHAFQCWNRYIHSRHITNSLHGVASNHLSNVAFQCMFGFELFHQQKYIESINCLKRADSLWKHPYIVCAIADSLLKLRKYKSSLVVLRSLIAKPWTTLITYLDSCCIEVFSSDLVSKIYEIFNSCSDKLFDTKITIKWINKSIIFQTFFLSTNPDKIKVLSKMIRLKYWNNSHYDALQYIKKLQMILKQSEATLDVHSFRICYLTLIYMHELELCRELIKHQLHFHDNNKFKCSCDYTNCKERCYMFCQAIQLLTFENIKSKKAILNNVVKYCISADIKLHLGLASEDPGVHGIIASYLAGKGSMEVASIIFANGGLGFVNDGENSRICIQPLCLGQWFFWYSYARYMHGVIKDFKRAKYLYILAIKHNPYDSSSYFWYSVLMLDCQRFVFAFKYWKKAQELALNNTITYLFTDVDMVKRHEKAMNTIREHIIGKENECKCYRDFDCEEIFEVCNWCSKKSSKFKKCSQCKAVFYCSVKCQKLDWKQSHRSYCIAWTKVNLISNKLYYFFLRHSKILK
eukprot:462970_1